MASPLQGPIAAKIGKAFAKTFYDAILTRTTKTVPAGQPSWDLSGPPTSVDHACLAIIDTYSKYALANSVIEAGDVKVLILATSLAVTPSKQDTVLIRGVRYKIIDVGTDPAIAVWELQCRR